ncbi:MAG: hypothetical protein WBN15_00200 [Polyangiales bacterium]
MIACSESFAPPSAVTDLRVVGARIDVQGAPARANPSPGDDIQASILVIDRGATPNLTWFFVACVPTATRIGVPICGMSIPGCDGCVGPPPSDPFAFPVVRFQVPSAQKLDAVEATEVLLQGVVCGNGSPSAEAIAGVISGETNDLVLCEGPPIVEGQPVEGRLITVQIPIERDPEDPNLNPEILDGISLNGSFWPPPYAEGVPRDEPLTGCKADLDALTEQDQAKKHPVAGSPPSSINLSVTPGSLQSFTIDGEDFTEEIQVSWLADGGGFEVAFSFITDPARSVLTLWQPSSEAPADGRLVRLNFVVRDGRGGLDRLERGLCVLPPAPAESPP